MNIIFHTTAAIGLIATLNDTRIPIKSNTEKLRKGLTAFLAGIVSHGALDYIPHCYPINPKVDVAVGALIILTGCFFSCRSYRLIVVLTLLGSIFPDIVDLSPQILNKYLGTSLPIFEKVFPWHWEEYSGSIFIDNCITSSLNHTILVTLVGFICLFRRHDLYKIFDRNCN